MFSPLIRAFALQVSAGVISFLLGETAMQLVRREIREEARETFASPDVDRRVPSIGSSSERADAKLAGNQPAEAAEISPSYF